LQEQARVEVHIGGLAHHSQANTYANNDSSHTYSMLQEGLTGHSQSAMESGLAAAVELGQGAEQVALMLMDFRQVRLGPLVLVRQVRVGPLVLVWQVMRVGPQVPGAVVAVAV